MALKSGWISTEKSQIIRPKKRGFEFLAEALENGPGHVLLKGHLILWTHFKVISNLILYGFFDLPFWPKLCSWRKVKRKNNKPTVRQNVRPKRGERERRPADENLLLSSAAAGERCAGETRTEGDMNGKSNLCYNYAMIYYAVFRKTYYILFYYFWEY